MGPVFTALFAMIASRSDVTDARDVVEEVFALWNASHAAKRNIVLVPLCWEAGAVPMLESYHVERTR